MKFVIWGKEWKGLLLGAVLIATLLVPISTSESNNDPPTMGTIVDRELWESEQRADLLTTTYHPPIDINGNDELVAMATGEGWQGNGSRGNPYMIQEFELRGSDINGSLLELISTSLYVVIRDNLLHIKQATFGYGIMLYRCQNCVIESNNITNMSSRGIYIWDSSNISINRNSITHILAGASPGIDIDAGNSIRIENNSIGDVTHGIEITGRDIVVTNNTLVANDVGMIISGDHLQIRDNRIESRAHGTAGTSSALYNEDAVGQGISLIKIAYSTIENNTMYGCGMFLDPGNPLNFYTNHIPSSNSIDDAPVRFFRNDSSVINPTGFSQLFLTNCTGVLIDRQTIRSPFYGIYLLDSSGAVISNSTFESDCESQITVDCPGCRVMGNSFTRVMLDMRGPAFEVRGNDVSDVSMAIRCSGSDGIVARNRILRASEGGIQVQSTNYTIADNTIDSTLYSICLGDCINASLTGNDLGRGGLWLYIWNPNIRTNRVDGSNLVCGLPILVCIDKSNVSYSAGYGQVLFLNCTNFTLSDSIFTSYWTPIAISSCTNGTVVNCTTRGTNIDDFLITHSNGINIIGCTFEDGSWAPDISDSSNCTFLRNRVINTRVGHSSRNTAGLELSGCSNMTIERNLFEGIQGMGITAFYLTYSSISFNQMNGTWECGIYIYYGDHVSIHHNNLLDTVLHPYYGTAGGPQANCTGNDIEWSEGKEGNYWSDYTLRYPEATNDGLVWNMPYQIPGKVGSEDPYPLVHAIESNPPTAVAGEDFVAQVGERVGLSGTGSTDDTAIVRFRWSFLFQDKLIEFTQPVMEFTFYVPGTYEISLEVWDAARNWDSDTVVVTVIDSLPPRVEAGADVVIAQNSSATLNGSATVDNYYIDSFLWRFSYNGQDIRLSGSTVQWTFDIPGRYSVILDVTDLAGNSASDGLNVTVMDTWAPRFAHPDWVLETAVTENLTLIYDWRLWSDNDPLYPQGAGFSWLFQGETANVSVTGSVAIVRIPRPGPYDAIFGSIDAAGNEAYHEFRVLVEWRPTTILPPIADAGGDLVVELNSTVRLHGGFTMGDLDVDNLTWMIPLQPPRYSYFGDVSFLADELGVLECSFTVRDWFGTTSVDWVNVTVVPRAPRIELSMGQFSSPLSGAVELTGRLASDVDSPVVYFRVDDGDWQTAQGTTRWYFVLDTRAIENGPHNLTIRAWDGYSNGTVGPIAFEVKNEDNQGGNRPSKTLLGVPWPYLLAGILLVLLLGLLLVYRSKVKRLRH